jgi:SAM-dependent methyltransferase
MVTDSRVPTPDSGSMNRAVRDYWNARIHDTHLSDDPPGSAEFYAALDAYRLRKCEYLPRVVDFDGWAGRDVLEIGCGPGLDLVRFGRGGARVTGVDIAPAAIELAQGALRAAGLTATLVEADGARLPFPDASFDLVYCHGVLSFVRDPRKVVEEAHRVLRPGGEAVLMVYNRRSWMWPLIRAFGAQIGSGHADAPGFRTYTREEFEGLVEAFPQRRFLAERLPFEVTRREGLSSSFVNRGLAPLRRALPDRWLRPYGWHLMAFCRKAA